MPDAIQELVSEASAVLKGGDHRSAAAIIDPVLALVPGHADANALGGIVSLLQGRVSEAAQRLAIAFEEGDPLSGQIALYYASALAALDLGAKAQEILAAYQLPHGVKSLFEIAENLIRERRGDAAVRVYRLACTTPCEPASDKAELWTDLAFRQVELGDHEGAEETLCRRLGGDQLLGVKIAVEAAIAYRRQQLDVARNKVSQARAVDPERMSRPPIHSWLNRIIPEEEITAPAVTGAAAPGLGNMLFCHLTHSGSSAIAPMLLSAMGRLGVQQYPYFNDPPETLPPSPFFAASHSGPEKFLRLLEQGHFRTVFLHRDPRDVAVSMVEDQIHAGRYRREDSALHLRGMPASAEFQALIRSACRWVELSATYPIKVVRFDDLKQDTVGVTLDVLAFYGIDINDELVDYLRDAYLHKYSFEAVANRPRGSDGRAIRTVYMVRRGISGEWYEQFDEQAMKSWDANLGDEIEYLGYGTSLVLGELKRLRRLEAENAQLRAKIGAAG